MTPIVDQMTEAELVDGEVAHDEATPNEAERRRDEVIARLDDFGQALAKTRSEAIEARRASGIEDIWLEDEEFYEGIDEANRYEQRALWHQKPPGRALVRDENTTRSTVFPNITGPYVEAAAARIADMLLPTDDRSWAIKPTPVPELLDISQGRFPDQMLRNVAAMHPGQPQLAMQMLSKASDEATRTLDEANEKAEKAQTRIEDWHVECQWHAQVRLVIEDAARIGVGVLKGPVPTKKSRVAFLDGALVVVDEIKPGSKWIDPWNLFPDGACGENIHDGAYIWERDHITRKQLRDLRGQEGYIDEQIDLVLEEGPHSATEEQKDTPDPVNDPAFKDKFEIWYFHGVAEKEHLEAAGCECSDMTDPHVPAMITMVNSRVIRASLNPLDTGDFPYDVMVWRRMAGHWMGQGVARQIRTPQRMIVAATRNLMDNAGLAAGPMLVYMQGKLVPANGRPGIAPRKVWYVSEDAESVEDATRAIGFIKIDMLVGELLRIIEVGLKFAEQVTSLPLLLQGQQGRAPDTVGGMQLLNNNATSVLRRLARLFDDRITEPHVRRYYNWLLMYGDDSEKGDFSIDARGSSALVERDIQNQEVAQMGNIVLNPVFGVDPKKWMQEFLKSRHFDPKRFDYDDDQWQQIVANLSRGPQDPRLAIAQLRTQSDERQRQFESALKTMDQRFEADQAERDRQLELVLHGMDSELETKRQSGDQTISFAEIKALLAKTAMQLRTQISLSRESAFARQVTKPPTEPVGRAPNGQAFQR